MADIMLSKRHGNFHKHGYEKKYSNRKLSECDSSMNYGPKLTEHFSK